MAPTKKGEKKKGRSAINEVVTREYTINIHKRIHGVWVQLPSSLYWFIIYKCVHISIKNVFKGTKSQLSNVSLGYTNMLAFINKINIYQTESRGKKDVHGKIVL